MSRRLSVFCLAACAPLTACAAADDLAAVFPGRLPLVLHETPIAADAETLVGQWRCREMNPYPDQAPVLTGFSFEPDGGFVEETSILLEGRSLRAEDLILVLEGRYRVDAGLVFRESLAGATRSRDGSAQDADGTSMMSVMEAFAAEAETFPLEILRATADELILRETGDDKATLECRRVGS